MDMVEITAAAVLSAYNYYNFLHSSHSKKKLNNPIRGDEQQQYTETEQSKVFLI
jgi:hypothetical protein